MVMEQVCSNVTQLIPVTCEAVRALAQVILADVLCGCRRFRHDQAAGFMYPLYMHSQYASRAGCQGCKILHKDVVDFSDWRVASPHGKTSAQDVFQQVPTRAWDTNAWHICGVLCTENAVVGHPSCKQ